METKKVACPLIGRDLEFLDCMDAAYVAEGIQPERFALAELRAVPNFREICNSCPNHHKD